MSQMSEAVGASEGLSQYCQANVVTGLESLLKGHDLSEPQVFEELERAQWAGALLIADSHNAGSDAHSALDTIDPQSNMAGFREWDGEAPKGYDDAIRTQSVLFKTALRIATLSAHIIAKTYIMSHDGDMRRFLEKHSIEVPVSVDKKITSIINGLSPHVVKPWLKELWLEHPKLTEIAEINSKLLGISGQHYEFILPINISPPQRFCEISAMRPDVVQENVTKEREKAETKRDQALTALQNVWTSVFGPLHQTPYRNDTIQAITDNIPDVDPRTAKDAVHFLGVMDNDRDAEPLIDESQLLYEHQKQLKAEGDAVCELQEVAQLHKELNVEMPSADSVQKRFRQAVDLLLYLYERFELLPGSTNMPAPLQSLMPFQLEHYLKKLIKQPELDPRWFQR